MKKLSAVALLTAVLVAVPAMAQTYLGLGAGAAKTNANKTSWNLYGGYQFNPVLGLEVGYTDLGRYRGADIESWTLAGVAAVPMTDTWSLLGKLGAAANRPHFADSSNHTDLLFGVGVGFKMNKNLGLRLEYDDFGRLSNSASGDNSRGRNLGLSLKYAY